MEAAIEIDLQALDVNRNRIFPFAAAMGNGVCRIVYNYGGRLELQIKPQHIDIAEKRTYPTSGNRSAIRVTVADGLPPALEVAPKTLGVGPNAADFVGEATAFR